MLSQLAETKLSSGQFIWTYIQLAGCWQGCDWATGFGASGLNLNGLRSDQASLLALATSGREAADWQAAARWLENVETDARAVEAKAAQAAELAESGRLNEALHLIGEVCAVEERYHAVLVWQPLRKVIAAAARDEGLSRTA